MAQPLRMTPRASGSTNLTNRYGISATNGYKWLAFCRLLRQNHPDDLDTVLEHQLTILDGTPPPITTVGFPARACGGNLMAGVPGFWSGCSELELGVLAMHLIEYGFK
jgi:hypothetical protein